MKQSNLPSVLRLSGDSTKTGDVSRPANHKEGLQMSFFEFVIFIVVGLVFMAILDRVDARFKITSTMQEAAWNITRPLAKRLRKWGSH